MLKMSDICILLSVFVAFITTAYLWFKNMELKEKLKDKKK